MTTKIPYSKSYTEESSLIALLQSRGLSITDESKAQHYLTHIGYYRLSAYMYPLLCTPKEQHIYKKGTTFDKVMMLYRFDKKLRLLLFNEIEKIEVAVRIAVVKHGCEVTGDTFWMTNQGVQFYAWDYNGSDDDDKPVTQCTTPSVSYEAGELKFACATAGAKYHYTISDNDMATDALSEDGKVSLSAAYNISVYATADGYTASEKAEATLYWINANQETTNINLAKTRGIMATAHDGIVSISGLDNGEVVMFYAADGKLIGSSPAVGGVASCAVSEKMVIAKIGMNTIKVSMK